MTCLYEHITAPRKHASRPGLNLVLDSVRVHSFNTEHSFHQVGLSGSGLHAYIFVVAELFKRAFDVEFRFALHEWRPEARNSLYIKTVPCSIRKLSTRLHHIVKNAIYCCSRYYP